MPQIKLPVQPKTHINPDWPWRRKARVWLFLNVVPRLFHAVWFLLHKTLRWRSRVDPESEALIKNGAACVFPFWHTDLLQATSISRLIGVHKRTVVMVGLSQAGEVETRLLKRLKYQVVRGSRKQRSVEVMHDMLDAFRQGAIAGVTVDGPSGPLGVVKPGVLIFARHGKVPIIPMGFSVDRCWVLNTWDRAVIPKPFARCVVNIGAPMREDWEGGDEQLTVEQVGEELNRLRDEAPAWDDCVFDPEFRARG